MKLSWEAIGGICAVFGVFWALYVYYNRITPEYKEARSYMYEQFNLLKKLNKEVLTKYEDFCNKYDCWDVNIAEGLTFRFGIEKMKQVYIELNHSDNHRLSTTTKSIRNIESLTEGFKKQIEYHSGLQTNLELFQNHIDINHPYLNFLAENKDMDNIK